MMKYMLNNKLIDAKNSSIEKRIWATYRNEKKKKGFSGRQLQPKKRNENRGRMESWISLSSQLQALSLPSFFHKVQVKVDVWIAYQFIFSNNE